jgi:hypothetical protein
MSTSETVSQMISDSYVRWQWLEAMLKLAQSPNAKMVVVGNDASGGPPLILGGLGDAAPASPGSAPSADSSSPVSFVQQQVPRPEPGISTQ